MHHLVTLRVPPSSGWLPPPRHAARATPPRAGSHHPVTLREPPLLGQEGSVLPATCRSQAPPLPSPACGGGSGWGATLPRQPDLAARIRTAWKARTFGNHGPHRQERNRKGNQSLGAPHRGALALRRNHSSGPGTCLERLRAWRLRHGRTTLPGAGRARRSPGAVQLRDDAVPVERRRPALRGTRCAGCSCALPTAASPRPNTTSRSCTSAGPASRRRCRRLPRGSAVPPDRDIATPRSTSPPSYYLGRGAAQDYAQAAEWYREAAKGGDVGAQYILASMYKEGLGVSRDLRIALYWYTRAAQQGDLAAAGMARELARNVDSAR